MKATSNAKGDWDSEPKDSQKDEVLREWGESAFYWQKHAGTIRTMFGPITQALIEDADIIEGDAVLDVAGGAGEPSLTIAETVGPTGSVTCTDVTPEMVSAAESEAQRRGLTNVVFRQCDADSLPFDSKSFDAVVCRLGVMFFPDITAALREMLRVTRHDGGIALAVWGKSELNPGAVEVKERMLKFDVTAPISPSQFWELRAETSGTLREKLATLSPVQANSLAQEAQEAVREYFSHNQMSIPAQMIIVTGRKP